MEISLNLSKSAYEAYVDEQYSPFLKKTTKIKVEIEYLTNKRDNIYALFKSVIEDPHSPMKLDVRSSFIWEQFKKFDERRADLEQRNRLLLKKVSELKLPPKMELSNLIEWNTQKLQFKNFWKGDLLNLFETLKSTRLPRSWCTIS